MFFERRWLFLPAMRVTTNAAIWFGCFRALYNCIAQNNR